MYVDSLFQCPECKKDLGTEINCELAKRENKHLETIKHHNHFCSVKCRNSWAPTELVLD